MKPNLLPVDSIVPDILQTLENNNAAVVVAQPGAGKTTRVPPALLSANFAKGKEIWVLQPRRLAAKLAALRVAEEMGEKPGQQVGYQFRFEKCVGPQTRLRFLTDGMLLPLAQADPEFKQVAVVILDEFHERSLELDLSLAWLRRLQQGPRPDLRLLVMSATLDAESLSSYLSNCPVFKSDGRLFPVRLEYLPFPQQPDLSLKVRSAVREIFSRKIQGTTLVFLPGLYEIKRCAQALSQEPFEVHSLYGSLSVEEQQRVLSPSPGNKVILSTNVAETSLTVQGVTAVIDSGLTRQSRVSSWSGLQSLVTIPASQASSAQRTGRAGRLQEGLCLRLYTQYDFDHRAAFDLPELLRADLSRSVLDLKCLGVSDLSQFPWFLKPPPGSLESAQLLLKRLGALDKTDQLTPIGRRMAQLPISPRLAKFLLEVEQLKPTPSTLRWACRLACLISEEKAGGEDVLEELKKYQPGYESEKLEEKLSWLMNLGQHKSDGKNDSPDHSILAKGLLAAFPDRVAQTRSDNQKELLLCEGGAAIARDSALVREHDYFVILEAQELDKDFKVRLGDRVRTQSKIRSMCAIEMDWLLDLFPDDLIEKQTFQWNNKAQRIEGFQRLGYGQLILDEKVLAPKDFGPEAEALLLKEALAAGSAAYCDPEELSAFLNRVRFAGEQAKDFPKLSSMTVEETLAGLCKGCRSLEDLRSAGLVSALRYQLNPKDQARLEQLAPAHVTLPSGRKLAVHYDEGKPPWAQSRIQDFFGMKLGPTVANGQTAVVLHLLSPRQQPLQVTSDLSGFWKNHYPQIRKEMMRRYPRHKWPENPLIFIPDTPKPRHN
jgi:ATP-dependent helicase HrpB